MIKTRNYQTEQGDVKKNQTISGSGKMYNNEIRNNRLDTAEEGINKLEEITQNVI